MNGKPRTEAWAEESDATKLRLIINELDEFDAAIREMNNMIRKRLNWILGLFVGALLAGIVNLIVIVAQTKSG